MRRDHDNIADPILAASGWARVGITAPNERLRQDAALELARFVISNDRKRRSATVS